MSSINKKTTFNRVFKEETVSFLSLYPNKTIGDKIKLLRIKSGLTYNQFAKKAQVAVMTIYRWESNERIPSDRYLNQLINNFNLNKDYFNLDNK